MKKFIFTTVISLLILSFDPHGLIAFCPHCQQQHTPGNSLISSGYTSGKGFARYPKELDSIIEKLCDLPEGKELIEKVTKEGPVSISLQKGLSFPAFWETEQRLVLIDPDKNPTEGSRLTCLVFELHNALHDPYFQRYIQGALRGSMSKNQYVEAVERMEHQTGLKTSTLLQKGVKEGLFPRDARQPTFQNFDEHFRMVQRTGHSRWIADSYERMRRNQPHRITDRGYHS